MKSSVSPGHVPVLCARVTELLVTDPAGTYVDGTLGGGGHSAALLARVTGPVVGIDRDPEAVAAAAARLAAHVNFRAVPGDWRQAWRTVDGPVQGVLLDVGLSSRQLDDAARGFAFRLDGPLDMRFDRTRGVNAAQWLERADAEKLARVLREYGELPRALRLAQALLAARPLTTTAALAAAAQAALPAGPRRDKELARVFQALRIAVNGELDGWDEALRAWLDKLAPGGRLAVIAYHSLEDRTVKAVFRDGTRGCICPPALAQCGCGRRPWLRAITRGAEHADDAEIAANPRARSARLRVAEKV
jgi:16S rRNA (cytosine1402-N4)-methyltransferase